MKYFLGVDPGALGAIAVINEDNVLLAMYDMPYELVKIGNTKKKRVLPEKIQQIVSEMQSNLFGTDCVAWVERVSARPGQGVSSCFAFGEAYGLVRGVLAGLCIPTHTVSPTIWKKALRLGSGKESSRLMAIDKWPKDAGVFKRVKDDGRAEAALLAMYGLAQQK